MPKKILYCVLNWGLGHASRSVPIIRDLLRQGNHITIASDGGALKLMKKEFPLLHSIELPSYNIKYKYESIAFNMAMQARKFLRAIRKEKQFIDVLVQEHGFQQIISDNRFGCYHKSIPSVFLTHQIRLLHKKRFLQAAGTAMNTQLIEKFDVCWVPDYDKVENLTGKMSRNVELNIPIEFIEPQSRFSKIDLNPKTRFVSLSILSGPEPQLSYLQAKILKEVHKIKGEHAIVSGKDQSVILEKNVTIFGLLDEKELTALIAQSKHIISRSGYSSIMDYEAMERKAILIPTPGQSEQEYLALRAHTFDRHVVLSQSDLHLKELLI